jgi:hypothetical protein
MAVENNKKVYDESTWNYQKKIIIPFKNELGRKCMYPIQFTTYWIPNWPLSYYVTFLSESNKDAYEYALYV